MLSMGRDNVRAGLDEARLLSAGEGTATCRVGSMGVMGAGKSELWAICQRSPELEGL